MKYIVYYFVEIVLKTLLFIIPKKKDLILFGAWFGQKYIDNTKYVYEYMLEKEDMYDVRWYTRNKHIYNKLRCEGKPTVLANTLKGRWTLLRASLLVSTVQTADFEGPFITNCKYLDLGHGHPIKDCGDIVQEKIKKIGFRLSQLYVDYYTAVSGPIAERVVCKEHNTRPNHIFRANFARNDFFYDKSLHKGATLPVPFPYKGKTIVYMPTHRKQGDTKMPMEALLNLKQLNQLCKDTDSVFIVKKHFYHRNEKEDFSNYERIFDFTSKDLDPQLFLLKADILITDYSACYVDYLLLDRPIVFYQYDYNQFQEEERSLIIPFEKIHIGAKPHTPDELYEEIRELLKKGDNNQKERSAFMDNYFYNPTPYHGREDIRKIIKKMMKEK